MNGEAGISNSQYITWFLAVAGWFFAGVVARYVLRKNARNSWIGDVKKALSELEDSAVDFWMGENNDNESIQLNKLKRKVKEITTLAGEIQTYGGQIYPLEQFIKLRQAVTKENYIDEVDFKLVRSLPASDERIFLISSACADLFLIYVRS
jgi:hypothetical protein